MCLSGLDARWWMTRLPRASLSASRVGGVEGSLGVGHYANRTRGTRIWQYHNTIPPAAAHFKRYAIKIRSSGASTGKIWYLGIIN